MPGNSFKYHVLLWEPSPYTAKKRIFGARVYLRTDQGALVEIRCDACASSIYVWNWPAKTARYQYAICSLEHDAKARFAYNDTQLATFFLSHCARPHYSLRLDGWVYFSHVATGVPFVCYGAAYLPPLVGHYTCRAPCEVYLSRIRGRAGSQCSF